MLASERAILQVLSASNQEMYGRDIVKASNGALHRGTVYVYLQRLEERSCIASRLELESWQPLPRRLYCITEAGRGLLSKGAYAPAATPLRRFRFARREGYGVWDSLRYAVWRNCRM